MKKNIFVFCPIILFFVSCTQGTYIPANKKESQNSVNRRSAATSSEGEMSIQRVLSLPIGADEDKINQVMEGKYIQRKSIPLGGSGDCYYVFKFSREETNKTYLFFPMNRTHQLSSEPIVVDEMHPLYFFLN